MSQSEVNDAMPEQEDMANDRAIIAARLHITENRSDWKNWQAVDVS
jgi:hypothetical protein